MTSRDPESTGIRRRTGETVMTEKAIVVTQGQGRELNVIGTKVRFLCDAGQTGRAWSAMEVVLPKDTGPPPHNHAWDEAYYVLAGKVQFMLGTDTVLAGEGDFIYAPGGAPHGFRGVSESPARLLILDAPAHAGGFFADVDREVTQIPQDLTKVPEIGRRHGIHFAPAG
jgi:quercetin dioxygenase-like cupin family protein